MAKQDPVIAMAPLKEVPTFPGQLVSKYESHLP